MNDYEYRSLQQIVSSTKYPFTIGQLRHYLLKRHKNGLDKADAMTTTVIEKKIQ